MYWVPDAVLPMRAGSGVGCHYAEQDHTFAGEQLWQADLTDEELCCDVAAVYWVDNMEGLGENSLRPAGSLLAAVVWNVL